MILSLSYCKNSHAYRKGHRLPPGLGSRDQIVLVEKADFPGKIWLDRLGMDGNVGGMHPAEAIDT